MLGMSKFYYSLLLKTVLMIMITKFNILSYYGFTMAWNMIKMKISFYRLFCLKSNLFYLTTKLFRCFYKLTVLLALWSWNDNLLLLLCLLLCKMQISKTTNHSIFYIIDNPWRRWMFSFNFSASWCWVFE